MYTLLNFRNCLQEIKVYLPSSDEFLSIIKDMRAEYEAHLKPLDRMILRNASTEGTFMGLLKEVCINSRGEVCFHFFLFAGDCILRCYIFDIHKL